MPDFENPAAFLLLLFIPILFLLRKLKIFRQLSFDAVLSDWQGHSFEWKGKSQNFLSLLASLFFTAARKDHSKKQAEN